MFSKFFKKINCPPLSNREQGIFAERLSFLIGASLSLPESVALMRNSFGRRRSAALFNLQTMLESGANFESALASSLLCFSRTIILAGRIGERSGTLAESLIAASARIERGRAVKSTIVSAMTYPVIIFLASTGIIAFLVFYIMPKIMPTIQSLHMPLPPVTVFFIFASHFLVDDWWKIAVTVVSISGILFFLYRASWRFRNSVQRFALCLPLVSDVIRAYMLSEIFNIILTLIAAGCPFVEAVGESSAFLAFITYRLALSSAVAHMQTGSDFSTALRRHLRLFPLLAIDSIAIGERTGNVEAVLRQMNRYYARELESTLAGFGKLIEPALMIIVGIIVGAAALSIVLPIYEISQHLSG